MTSPDRAETDGGSAPTTGRRRRFLTILAAGLNNAATWAGHQLLRGRRRNRTPTNDLRPDNRPEEVSIHAAPLPINSRNSIDPRLSEPGIPPPAYDAPYQSETSLSANLSIPDDSKSAKQYANNFPDHGTQREDPPPAYSHSQATDALITNGFPTDDDSGQSNMRQPPDARNTTANTHLQSDRRSRSREGSSRG